MYPESQLYFLGSIDVAKFYVRLSFSFFDRTFETKLPWQSPAGVKTGILEKRMKTVANETCFEVPRKNRLVHVVKNWLQPALYCVLQVVARYLLTPKSFWFSLNGKKIALNLGGNCSSIRTPGIYRILLRFFHASIL